MMMLADDADIGVDEFLVDLVPAVALACRLARVASGLAQGRIGAISSERVRKGIDRAGANQTPGEVVGDEAAAARRARRNDGQPRRHRLQGHVAERLRDRWIEQHVHRGDGAAEILTALEAGEDRIGEPLFEPFARRPLADDQHLVPHPATREPVDRLGKDVEALFHHEPADEADHRLVVGDAEAPAPRHVAPPGIEDRPIDAAGPDSDIVVHALVAQQLRHRLRGREDRVAAPVEAPQHRKHRGLEKGQAIVARIGLEPRMDRGDDGKIPFVRQRHRPVPENFGAGDVEDVRGERPEVALHARRDHEADLVFRPPRDREPGDVDEIAGRREGRLLDRRRINADLRAAPEEIAGEPVQRLVRPVADIIVIAAEDGHAKVGHVHFRRHMEFPVGTQKRRVAADRREQLAVGRRTQGRAHSSSSGVIGMR